MKLTEYQQAMLDGAHGKGKEMAMRILVGIGKCFYADRLVPVTRAHVSLSAQEADTWFAKKLFDAGAACAVTPTVNPGYSLDYFGPKITREAVDHMVLTHNVYKGLGARLTYCCTPYLEDNVPEYGEIVSFAETSATVYVNSVLGARSNRESSANALCSAVTGFAPEYGLLLDENRVADTEVYVEAPVADTFDYALLGMCGKKIGKGVPLFRGLPETISTEALIALGSELNVSGVFGLYHIPGVTGEMKRGAPVYEERRIKRRVTITGEDLEKALEALTPYDSGEIEYCVLGCPHYTDSQVELVERLLAGEASRVPIYILTSARVKERAGNTGLEERLLRLGAEIIADTCVDETCCWQKFSGRPGVTDSPKGAYYMEASGIRMPVRDIATCIRWAKKGRIG